MKVGTIERTERKVRQKPFLTLNGALKYMVGDSVRREKTLLDFKYPEPEGEAQRDYYRPALEIIRKYHDAGNDRSLADRELRKLETYASDATEAKVIKLDHNSRVVRAFLGSFGSRRLVPLPHDPKVVMCEGVELWLRPDLVASEGKRIRVIRFACQKDGISRDEEILSLQFLRYYARESGLTVGNADCQLFVLADGRTETFTGSIAKFEARLKAAMREVRQRWPFL